MGHTSEQRSKNALCGAMTKRGVRCRAFAGQGTDHPGVGSCKFHGGSTRNGKKRALALEAKQRMVAMSVPVEDAQPHAILLHELTVSAGHVGWLREEIATLKPREIGDERSRVLLTRYDDERERLTRIAKACSDAGVDDALIRIEQVKAMQVVRVITDAARDAGIPRDYITALGPALRRQFALLAGDDDAADEQEERVAAVREKIRANEERRARKAAQAYSGLTFPPDEMVIDGREAGS